MARDPNKAKLVPFNTSLYDHQKTWMEENLGPREQAAFVRTAIQAKIDHYEEQIDVKQKHITAAVEEG